MWTYFNEAPIRSLHDSLSLSISFFISYVYRCLQLRRRVDFRKRFIFPSEWWVCVACSSLLWKGQNCVSCILSLVSAVFVVYIWRIACASMRNNIFQLNFSIRPAFIDTKVHLIEPMNPMKVSTVRTVLHFTPKHEVVKKKWTILRPSMTASIRTEKWQLFFKNRYAHCRIKMCHRKTFQLSIFRFVAGHLHGFDWHDFVVFVFILCISRSTLSVR